jgi:hypothetical protein
VLIALLQLKLETGVHRSILRPAIVILQLSGAKIEIVAVLRQTFAYFKDRKEDFADVGMQMVSEASLSVTIWGLCE